jgi:hypothetical protein
MFSSRITKIVCPSVYCEGSLAQKLSVPLSAISKIVCPSVYCAILSVPFFVVCPSVESVPLLNRASLPLSNFVLFKKPSELYNPPRNRYENS